MVRPLKRKYDSQERSLVVVVFLMLCIAFVAFYALRKYSDVRFR